MEVTVTETKQVPVSYLKAECGVRYWEDATVNGEQDDEDNPTIPFSSPGSWDPLIELDTGKIVGWPQGITADVHYKVCDAGVYTLLDADKNEVRKIDGYVPNMMCPEGGGYGDYVIMKIDATGQIANWKPDLSDFEEEGDD